MKPRKQLWKILALLLTLGLIAAACGSDDSGSSDSSGDDSSDETEAAAEDEATTEATDEATEEPADSEEMAGGEAVLIAEQWPECVNPITSCANASWLAWSVSAHVQARLMELTPEGGYQASPVLAEEPTAENGGVVENEDGTFVLTYMLNPDAVWSDGTPITCDDIEFTRDAQLSSTGALQTAGFDLITDVDCSTENTAVLTFSEPYAPWRDLFGGPTNYLLPAQAFESSDISEDWLDEVTVSGGPWILESWSPEQAVLTPNENYWDEERIPLLDRVIIVPREDTDSEIASLQAGGDQGVVAYPQPFPGAKDRLTGDISFEAVPGDFFEGLWLNEMAPESGDLLSNKAVREALLYSLDREEIAQAALGSVMDAPAVLQCALTTGPQVRDSFWCDESDFSDVTQDFDMVTEILEGDGWTLDGDCWEKDGEELIIDWNTVAGNQRREDVQALVQEMTRPIGICWTITNYDAGELFGNRLPALNFNMGLYANGNGPDPSVVQLYDINGIPSEENGGSGQNYTACTSDACAEASDLAFEADATLDEEAGRDIIFEVGDIIREEVVWIPLYMLPNITAWRADQIQGPIGLYGATLYGGFANMYDWSLAG